MKKRPTICTYYFPNWHVDPYNEELHGKSWTEWEVVKCARPRFPNHEQPKVPLWGYEDEADPKVMEKKIATATSYGIDAFIFDYYNYPARPYRERCLQEGFLKAANCQDMQFALMWCNHAPMYAHPGSCYQPCQEVLKCIITPEFFVECTDRIIKEYFSKPNYLRVNGGLYFSIYLPNELLPTLGGLKVARFMLDDFRARVEKAGLGKLYLDAILHPLLCDEPFDYKTANAFLADLNFDSGSFYANKRPDGFPCAQYVDMMKINLEDMYDIGKNLKVPFQPVAQVGYDCSPRTVQSDMFEKRGYPYSTILINNGPELWEKYLTQIAEYIDSPQYTGQLLHLACWNEWTEGCYLEPDMKDGFARLEAVKKVFGLKK